MRGGFLHNEVLIGRIGSEAERFGAVVRREHPTRPGRSPEFVDCLITYRGHRMVCEAELRPERVPNDIRKAIALEADILLIVVPTAGVARLARAQARPQRASANAAGLAILVAPLGTAIQRLKGILDFWTSPNVEASKSPKPSPTVEDQEA